MMTSHERSLVIPLRKAPRSDMRNQRLCSSHPNRSGVFHPKNEPPATKGTVNLPIVPGMAGDCVSIGRFDLEGFAPRPRGATQITVGFEIDANGIMHVSAKELSSGVEQRVNITGKMKISEEERKRLIEESKMFAGIDRARREEALLIGNADQLIYKAKKIQQELFLPEERKSKLDKFSADLRSVVEQPLDYAEENRKLESLKKSMVDLADLINDTIDVYEMGEGA